MFFVASDLTEAQRETTRVLLCSVVQNCEAGEWERSGQRDRNPPTSSFGRHKEVKMELKGQSWLVRPALSETGQEFHEQNAQEAEQRKKEELHGRRKRRKDDKLQSHKKW